MAPLEAGHLSRVPPMAIGSDTWPGLAKLAEECGELLAVVGRLMAFPDGVDHADRGGGSLVAQLEDEMADVVAAVAFVRETNSHALPSTDRGGARQQAKLERFEGWHEDALEMTGLEKPHG